MDAAEGALADRADVLVVDGSVELAALWETNPALVVVTITPFGCDGPWADRLVGSPHQRRRLEPG